MTPQDWQELLSDPSNWPDESAENWPAEWKLFYWATEEVWTDSTKLFEELEEGGLSGLFQDVLVQLGYEVTEPLAGTAMKEIKLSSKEQMHAIRRIARFLLEPENIGKSSQLISSELTDLGYQASP